MQLLSASASHRMLSRWLTNKDSIPCLDEIKCLDDNGVSELCKTIRRPGGTIANNDGVQILANPGTLVFHHKCLKRNIAPSFLLVEAYGTHFSASQTRRHDPPEAIKRLRQLREKGEDFVKPNNKPKINHKDWFQIMEAIKEYLAHQCPGPAKIPAFVVCNDMVEASPCACK